MFPNVDYTALFVTPGGGRGGHRGQHALPVPRGQCGEHDGGHDAGHAAAVPAAPVPTAALHTAGEFAHRDKVEVHSQVQTSTKSRKNVIAVHVWYFGWPSSVI